VANVVGTSGNDSLVGTNDNDSIQGLAGNDTLEGLAGADTLVGGAGDDTYFIGAGDILSDSGGVDIAFSSVSFNLTNASGVENLTLQGNTSGRFIGGNALNNRLIGSDGNDASINGRAGDDYMEGRGGNDTFDMSTGGTSTYGNDTIDGGAGIDTIDFGANARSALTVDLSAGPGRITGGGDGGTGSVMVFWVENVIGGAFADRMTGDFADNYLAGIGGNDSLNGMWGNDRLEGGTGADDYVFTVQAGADDADSIVGFASASDDIVLDGSSHGNLGAEGEFSTGDARFRSGAGLNAAQDPTDRVVYNTTTGQLWYDADGSGGTAAQLIATLQGAPLLAASDIVAVNSNTGSVFTGTSGNDNIFGTRGNDTLNGLEGNDSMNGSEGADLVVGGAGNDLLVAGYDEDFFGGVISDGSPDTLDGGLGDDRYFISDGDVVLADPGGYDSVDVSDSDEFTMAHGLEDLVYVENFGFGEIFFGTGNSLDNNMSVVASGGQLRGMGGNDDLSVEGGQIAFDVFGGDGDDIILGRASQVLNLFGEAGNDVLRAPDGGTLSGGSGTDSFVLDGAFGALTDIADFASGTDKIRLDADPLMPELGASGNFTANDERFHAGSAAAEADDRVIWNASTGELLFDPDGSGSGSARHLATLQTGANVVAMDIVIENGTTPGGGTINGTEGNDSLTGTPGGDTINGLGGHDTINGAGGSDSLNGGTGNDLVIGGGDPQEADGGAILVGGDGDDTLDGFDHRLFQSDLDADTMDGGLGNDLYRVDDALDVLTDTGGIDTVHAANTDWTLGAGFENLVLDTDEFEFGTGIGNALANHMSITWQGRLEGMGGDDTLVGGTGGTSDTLLGGDGNDVIHGNLSALADGGAGNDTLFASFVMTGGSGTDRFGLDFFDSITDFTTATDTLLLDGGFPEFANAGPSGRFSAVDARFHAAAGADAAHDASDRLIYNTSTGDLHYDSDGTGSATAVHLGVLDGAPTLVATDIEVINGTAPEPITGTEGNDTLTGTPGDDTIDGLGGNDAISGLEGADSLIGGAGNDTLDAGQDSTTGDGAADTLDGGSGDDVYRVSGDGDTILADAGGIDIVEARNADWTLGAGLENLELVDTVGAAFNGTGNELDNVIRGASEGGTLIGMGGNDTLILRNVQNFSDAHGGDGNDTLRGARSSELFGDAGNDVLEVGGIFNTLTGGAGNDHFVFDQPGLAAMATDFASGADKIRLDAQNMMALGASGNFTAGDERFHAGAAAAEADDRVIWNAATGELLYDADGSGSGSASVIATLQAGATVVGTDIIVDNGTEPEPGGEVITGTAGNDSLVGTNGNDTLDGVSGNDTLNGLLGDDTYIAQAGDVIQDSGGTDTLVTSSTWNIFSMPIENVTLAGSSNIGLLANNFDNHVIGNSAANSIEGRGGSDTIEGGGGNDYFKMSTGGLTAFGFDVIDGGDGIDTVDYGGTALSALVADLVAGTVTGGDTGGGGGAALTSIENFNGGNFDDRIGGSAAANKLFGNGGNDTLVGLGGHDSLVGGDGNDWLEGGSGFDTLVGGAGNDSFVFSATSGRVTDFVAADQLLFDNAFFAALGAESTWAAGDGRFLAAAGATTGADANDRLVYNTTNGNLYYDADGAGGAGSVLVTTLQNAPTLSAADISVI
jgi:Ca2+-binding RTX toxin-like protein